jgi:hypothetical protein
MTTFTIDSDNNITAFAGPDQAEAVIAAGAQPFATSDELTQLAAGWPTDRLVAIWNSLPGVTPAKGFKNPRAAASKIWDRIQSMAEPEKPNTRRYLSTSVLDAPEPLKSVQENCNGITLAVPRYR